MRSVVWFLLGAALGGTFSYFYFKDKFEKDAREETENERENSKRIIGEYIENEKELKKDLEVYKSVLAKNNIIIEKIDSDKDEIKEINHEDEEDESFLDMIKDYKGVDEKPFEIRDPSEKVSDDHPTDEDPDEPYIIGEEEFAEVNGYEKVNWDFYTKNGCVVETQGEIEEEVADINPIGGLDMLRVLDAGKVEFLYIRNDNLKMDFCLRKVKGYYEGD